MDNKPKVLIVDDDSNIRELMELYLEEDFDIVIATNGVQAVEKVKIEQPALVLLDIMLPQKNGWEACKEIRAFSKIPIVMVSAKGEEIDKVLGLELGADDYITKPFSPRELLARVKAHIRRNQVILEETYKYQRNESELKTVELDSQTYGEITINYITHKVYYQDSEIELTAKEFELLTYMVHNIGKVFTREQLLDKVWGYDYYGDSRAVDQTIKRLRKKLTTSTESNYIQTIWGVGYKFEVPS